MSTEVIVHTHSDVAVLRHRGPLHDLYLETFSGPPWNEPEHYADVFIDRLESVSSARGFRAVLAERGDTLLGFAYGLSTPESLPAGAIRDELTEALGDEGLRDYLIGAFEIDELAVRASARRRGIGRRLLDTLLDVSPDERAWLLTAADAEEARSFYERLGWRQILSRPTAHGLLLYVYPGDVAE